MGLSGVRPLSLLLILVIVLLVFGTKRLSTIGSDLGAAFRNFRKGLEESERESTGNNKIESKDKTD